MLKFLLNNFEAHCQEHFERYPTVEDFMDMDQDTCYFCHQYFSKHHETKINKGALKIITHKKKKIKKNKVTALFKEHFTKIYDISLVVIRYSFSQTNVVFKSNPVFIDILDSFCHSLFTFLPLCLPFFTFIYIYIYLYSTDFEVHPLFLLLFYRNQ